MAACSLLFGTFTAEDAKLWREGESILPSLGVAGCVSAGGGGSWKASAADAPSSVAENGSAAALSPCAPASAPAESAIDPAGAASPSAESSKAPATAAAGARFGAAAS